MAERRGQVAVKDLPPKLQKKLRRQKIMPKKARKLNRSMAGNALLFTLMFICGVFMALPLVMIINNALKPLDELYQFPPKIFVRNPNLRNFSDLFILMNDSWVPFSRYIMNTIIITVAGMVGHVIVASWAAYPLAKDKFPGKALLFGMVVLSMMFNWTVTQIPQYAIISWLHINNTYLALILPAWSFGMGLYLMKQFMEQLPDSLMESARVQGANEWQIFWKIVMPNVKPAWLTLAIFQFQQMWGNTGSLFLRDEQLKPMQYALQQITAGGVPRGRGGGGHVHHHGGAGAVLPAVPEQHSGNHDDFGHEGLREGGKTHEKNEEVPPDGAGGAGHFLLLRGSLGGRRAALHDVQLRLLGRHRVHARGVCAGGVDYRRFLPI